MSNRKALWTAVAAGLIGLTTVGTAHADRRTALNGNLLIEDRDDVYLHPQRAVRHRNLITLDYGAGQGSGNGLVLIGDETMTFGLGIHRGDLYVPGAVGRTPPNIFLTDNALEVPFIGPLTDPFGGMVGAPALTLVDAILAIDLGSESSVGFRVGLGMGDNTTTDAAGDDTGGSQTMLMLSGGYSMGGDLALDISGRLGLSLGSTIMAGQDGISGTDIIIGATARGFSKMSDTTQLGFFGDFGINSRSTTTPTGPDDIVGSTFGLRLQAGVGPVYKPTPRATVAGYATLGFATISQDNDVDDDNDAGTQSVLLFPGINASFEYQLTNWFAVRTGASYEHQFNGVGNAGNDDDGSSNQTEDFQWHAGFGLRFDDFRFDGTFSHGFLTQGPHFIGGTGSGLMAIASASYTWDGPEATGALLPTEEAAPTVTPSAAAVEVRDNQAIQQQEQDLAADPESGDTGGAYPAPATTPAPGML